MSYFPDCDLDATFEAIMSTRNHPMYALEMSDEYGEARQQVDITREEFIALKEHLCELRGLKPAEKAPGATGEQKM